MSYVWEQEYLPRSATAWDFEWHLKKIVGKNDKNRDLKISAAYIYKLGDRKYEAAFPHGQRHNDKTFRSLKAAKAYALAIVVLDN